MSQIGDVCVILTVAEKRYFLLWCFGGKVFLGDRTAKQEVANGIFVELHTTCNPHEDAKIQRGGFLYPTLHRMLIVNEWAMAQSQDSSCGAGSLALQVEAEEGTFCSPGSA